MEGSIDWQRLSWGLAILAIPLGALILSAINGWNPDHPRRAMLAVFAALLAWCLWRVLGLGLWRLEPQLAVASAVFAGLIAALVLAPRPWLIWSLFGLFSLICLMAAWLVGFFRLIRLF